jgi:hypothetical protein
MSARIIGAIHIRLQMQNSQPVSEFSPVFGSSSTGIRVSSRSETPAANAKEAPESHPALLLI